MSDLSNSVISFRRGLLKFPLFCFLLLIFLVQTSSAQDLTFPFNQKLDLKRTCENNGTYCSNNSICNLTVQYPDGSLLLDNKVMTNNFSFHNYTFQSSEINKVGIYTASMTCNDPSGDIVGDGFDSFNFEITGDGLSSSPFPIQIAILMIGIALIFLGKVRDDTYLFSVIGAIIIMIMGVITLYPGYSIFNFANLQGKVVGFSSIGLGFYFLLEGAFSRNRQVESFEQEDDGRFHD